MVLTWYALRISYTQEESNKKGKRKKKDLSRKNHSFLKKVNTGYIRIIYRLSMNTQNQLFSVDKIKRFLQGWHHVTAQRWHHNKDQGGIILYLWEDYFFSNFQLQKKKIIISCSGTSKQRAACCHVLWIFLSLPSLYNSPVAFSHKQYTTSKCTALDIRWFCWTLFLYQQRSGQATLLYTLLQQLGSSVFSKAAPFIYTEWMHAPTLRTRFFLPFAPHCIVIQTGKLIFYMFFYLRDNYNVLISKINFKK